MTKKLEPCPFCGGENVIANEVSSFAVNSIFKTAHIFKCHSCGTVIIIWAYTLSHAIEHYNRRGNNGI